MRIPAICVYYLDEAANITSIKAVTLNTLIFNPQCRRIGNTFHKGHPAVPPRFESFPKDPGFIKPKGFCRICQNQI